MDTGLLVIVVLALALAVRLVAGALDHTRIRNYVEQRGGRLLTARWAPFGRGWFGEKGERIYEVCWLDAQGSRHEAQCKTSLFSGVYFTDERAIERNSGPQRGERDLAAENARLRRELEELKSRHGGLGSGGSD
ncbi:MAG: hypothetical protein JNK02_00860 [Planctomycetes bacterium]|nr:hypothetical protein [Planctomycetota bacterium]